MLHHSRASRRRGTTLIECALVYPVAFLFIFAIIVGGMGMFRYQQIAWLARQGAHWASVHGSQYAKEMNKSATTSTDVYNKAILPNVVSLDTDKLSHTVTWSPDSTPPNSIVTVTVSYQWFPEVYLAGPITLTSTAKLPMAF